MIHGRTKGEEYEKGKVMLHVLLEVLVSKFQADIIHVLKRKKEVKIHYRDHQGK